MYYFLFIVIYNMFDEHNRGFLEEEQFLKLLAVLNRSTVFPQTFQEAIKEFDTYLLLYLKKWRW